MRFMMENRTVTGAEAVALGLAGEVAPDAAFADRLAAYCEELCAWSPITLRLLKRGVGKAFETSDLETQLRYEVSNIRRAFGSEDGRRPAGPSSKSASRCSRGADRPPLRGPLPALSLSLRGGEERRTSPHHLLSPGEAERERAPQACGARPHRSPRPPGIGMHSGPPGGRQPGVSSRSASPVNGFGQ